MKICQRCGAQNADHVGFCSACGTPFQPQQPQQPQPGYGQPQPGYGQPQPGYGQPPVQPVYGQPVYHQPVQTDRSLFMYILLTYVTCGIYSYFFTYKLAQDTNAMCFEDGETTPGLGMYILLSIITCGFYSYYWLYKIQNRLQAAGYRYGMPVAENGTTVILWATVGCFLCGLGPFIAMNIVMTSANKIGTAYNMKYVYNRT